MKQWVVKKKSCLATYTVERKNNVFKTLSEQSKLEKAEASLKNTERKDWNWKKYLFELSFLRSRLIEIKKSKWCIHW